jgi:retron-type reverse transcriptase
MLTGKRYDATGSPERERILAKCLEKSFDRVDHDILMSRIARRIGDKRLLLVIRRFL